MQMRPTIRLAATLITIALFASACTGLGKKTTASPGNSPGSTGQIIEGGQLRMGTTDFVDNTNPFHALLQDSYSSMEYIYPQLVAYDDNLDFVPSFATSWETSPDGKVWTFHTRPGVTWSDGQPLTAEDAAYTCNLDMMPGSGSGAIVKHMKSAEAPDANTLVLTYDAPVSNVLSQMQQNYIVPEHIWKDHDSNAQELRGWANPAPIVSGGPLTMTKWKRDDVALYEKNDTYWGPKPHIDSFGLKFYSNEDAMIQALLHDEIDAIETVPPKGVKPLQDAGMSIISTPGLTEDDFIINSTPNNPNHPELQNAQVREAFEYALDRQKIIDTVWLGQAQPAASFVQPAAGPLYNSDLKPLPFDVAKANQILDGLGYDEGPDGTRVADGNKMEYEVITPDNVTGIDRTFEIMKTDFADIGVTLNQKSVNSATAWDLTQAPIDEKTKIGKYTDFEMTLWDWTGLIDPDFMLSVLTCESYSVWNDSGYCNKDYDKMYSDQGAAVDAKSRKDIVWKMQEKIFNDRPYIMINYENWVSGFSPKWEGFDTTPQGIFNELSTDSLTDVHQVG